MRDETGPARLLDMVEGRSKAVFKQWHTSRPQTWRDRVEVVAMDGFTRFKTAAHSTPVPSSSPTNSKLSFKKCSQTASTLKSKRPGVPTSGWSPPTGNPTGASASL